MLKSIALALVICATATAQEGERVHAVVKNTLSEWNTPPGFWTDARIETYADFIVAELGPIDDTRAKRLIEEPTCRRSFEAMIRSFHEDMPYCAVPEEAAISRAWNESVFDLGLVRMKARLRRATYKLAASGDKRGTMEEQIARISRVVERTFVPARYYLEQEEFVALLRRQTKSEFRDAETLFAAVRRIGGDRLAELPDRLDRLEFSRPLSDDDFDELIECYKRRTSNFLVQGELKATVERLVAGRFDITFDNLIQRLYITPATEHFQSRSDKPDPEETELLERLETLQQELAAVWKLARLKSGAQEGPGDTNLWIEDIKIIMELAPSTSEQLTGIFLAAYNALSEQKDFEGPILKFKIIYYHCKTREPNHAYLTLAAYNVACGYSLWDKEYQETALDWLEVALRNGYTERAAGCKAGCQYDREPHTSFGHMEIDPDLENIRGTERFKMMLRHYKP